MKNIFSRGNTDDHAETRDMAIEAARGRRLIEESRELVLVLDEEERVVAASRRARESLAGVEEGERVPPRLLEAQPGRVPVLVPYEVDGRVETLVYLGERGDLSAYEELRSGFTAAVSHELRTPLARLLAILESGDLPGADPAELVARAKSEVAQIRELIDDVLFLSELETGREVVSLGTTPVRPILDQVVGALRDRARRAGITLEIDCEPGLALPLRPRMLQVLASNLAENAIRYAGDGSTFAFVGRKIGDEAVLAGVDDGTGVSDEDLGRLFERFYRADRARASRGTGLGLAIVKHIAVSANGRVEALHRPGGGLEIRCLFPG